MCYAIPGRVERLEGNKVYISYFGQIKKAINELISLHPGEYVYAQGGYVIQKINVLEAEHILEEWKELFSTLNEIDASQTQVAFDPLMLPPELIHILNKALEEKPLSDGEILSLLETREDTHRQAIYHTANVLRQKYHQNACCVHGIVEISNQCVRNCTYCGISVWNKGLMRYRMSKSEVLDTVREAVERYRFKALVLQSGEDPGAYFPEELIDIVKTIKEQFPVLLFISFGEMEEELIAKLFQAGARGLLMRFETSNPRLYAQLHPGFSLERRLSCLRSAYEMGYLILTGGLVGLPGQTTQDVLNDLYLTNELHAEMFSCGPYIPHPATPLAAGGASCLGLDMQLVLAVGRMVLAPSCKILVTTAWETVNPDARQQGLRAGANSLMLNATALDKRILYTPYPGRAHVQESISLHIEATINLLKKLGRVPTDLG